MSEIRNLNPQNVFGFFDDICAIPHGSGNMEGINKYLVDFAKERGLEYYTDEALNVVIIREAGPGYEDEPAVIMQAHVDMVCAKTDDKEIDFLTEAITPYIDGAYIKADRTSLGADDGIGAAIMLAVLDDADLACARVEAVFTTEEETSMAGANAVDLSMLKGKRMLNLDSEEEGIFTVTSAGGAGVKSTMAITREEFAGNAFKIIIHGSLGGHSGAEIHRGRANANQILGRALKFMSERYDMRLVSLEGGRAHNVISNLAEAVVIANAEYDDFDATLSELEALVRAEYASSDSGITLDSEALEAAPQMAMDKATTQKLIGFTFGAMHGIQYMSFDIEDLVETSMNFATMTTEGDVFTTVTSIRSSVESRLDYTLEKHIYMAEMFGMQTEVFNRYPGWEYMKESEFREKCVFIWTDMFGVQPGILALHAGLECGIFAKKIPGLDTVAVGPQLHDIHSVDETVEIASVGKTYDFIVEVLKRK